MTVKLVADHGREVCGATLEEPHPDFPGTANIIVRHFCGEPTGHAVKDPTDKHFCRGPNCYAHWADDDQETKSVL